MSTTIFMRALLAAPALSSLQPPAQTANPPVIERYSLDNGIRIVAVHAPGGERQCTFTFLPLSLATDPPGRAQWSHLLEHMIIRSTDAEGLVAGGVEFNGETGPDSLRLDTYAQPDSFRESFEKHARWLAADSFDGAVLAREKQVIAQEEQTVAQGLYTHKFAIAAWNQIVRHGADHAAVHGEVEAARAADVAEFAARALPVDESIVVCTIGPADLVEIRAVLEETIGRVPARPHDAVDSRATKAPLPAGAIEATWDLPVRHLILWWNLADDSAAARALALTIEMSIMQSPAAAGAGPALAASLWHLPEGPVLIVNAALSPDQNADAEEDRLIAHVNAAAAQHDNALAVAAMFAREIATVPDFEAYRNNLPAAQRAYLEANWLLANSRQELAWGKPAPDIATALQAVEADALARAAAPLTRPPAGALLLTPLK